MLKIGQNWGKIANYPPNAQQRSAPLPVGQEILNDYLPEKISTCEKKNKQAQ